MDKNEKDLPAKSEVNRDTDDTRFKQQEEFDNKQSDKADDARIENVRHNQQSKDSQQGRERMVPESKQKQSERDYQEDRKLPQIKK